MAANVFSMMSAGQNYVVIARSPAAAGRRGNLNLREITEIAATAFSPQEFKKFIFIQYFDSQPDGVIPLAAG